MRKLLITFLFLPLFVFAFDVPQRPTGFVQDFAGILTKEEVQELESKIQDFERNTTNEIAVVTIPSLDGDTIENIAQEIFTKWGIGKKDKNNGVLLLISFSDRQTRIHTGYGVEGDLTDIGTSYIQSEVVTPAFREERYFDGINGAVDKMIEALGGQNIVPENYTNSNFKFDGNLFQFIFIVTIIFFQVVLSILASTKSWWGGGVLGGVVSLAVWHLFIASIFWAFSLITFSVLAGLLLDYLVSKSYSEAKSKGINPWWMSRGGGGGFGGGSGGGGFGGFGGGMSGGGGSSSRW
jgi:uncharacterized protein